MLGHVLWIEYLMKERSEIFSKANLLISSAHDQIWRSDYLGYSWSLKISYAGKDAGAAKEKCVRTQVISSEQCVRTQGRSVPGAPVRRHRRGIVAEDAGEQLSRVRPWTQASSWAGCIPGSRLPVEQGESGKQATSWAGWVRTQVNSWAGWVRKQAVHGWSCLPLLWSLFIIFMI